MKHDPEFYMYGGGAIVLTIVLVVYLAAALMRRREAAARGIAGRTEPEWCVVLENVCRRLHDAKAEYWQAYREASDTLCDTPEHLKPILVHQLQLAQLHEKAVARALAKDGLAVETLFGDPEIDWAMVEADEPELREEPASRLSDNVRQLPQSLGVVSGKLMRRRSN